MNWWPFNWKALIAGMAATTAVLLLPRWGGTFCAADEASLDCWREWQALVGALIAAGAAAAVLFPMRRQLRQAEQQLAFNVYITHLALDRESMNFLRPLDHLIELLLGYREAGDPNAPASAIVSRIEDLQRRRDSESYPELRRLFSADESLAASNFFNSIKISAAQPIRDLLKVENRAKEFQNAILNARARLTERFGEDDNDHDRSAPSFQQVGRFW